MFYKLNQFLFQQQDEGGYCEPHDPEVPTPLIRAVSVFCHRGGFNYMSACFVKDYRLSIGLAHAMVAVICNLKLWLNLQTVNDLFLPLRTQIMEYMCNLSDKELRTAAVRTMAGNVIFVVLLLFFLNNKFPIIFTKILFYSLQILCGVQLRILLIP